MNITQLTAEEKSRLRIPYSLRRVPTARFATLLPCQHQMQPGDIAMACLEKIGKNARLELQSGRAATLYEGDLLAVVFGNRYATEQFEGYADLTNGGCDLLSMGGLCGLVKSRHASTPSPTKLRIAGVLGDETGKPLKLGDFRLPPAPSSIRPRVVIVCGTAMDVGKSYTAARTIAGLRRAGVQVAGIKLTGTASGRDTWGMLDAGASPALDFIDGGWPSTYLTPLDGLLELHQLLLSQAGALGAAWAVIEIADGLLQGETASLLRCPAFTETVDHWIFATSDPMAADGGVRLLRSWNIEPAAISGVISMSPLAMREAQIATEVRCLTAEELERGDLNHVLLRHAGSPPNGHTSKEQFPSTVSMPCNS